jgi:hypothetical protein
LRTNALSKVTGLLEGYASKGVFRGFSSGPVDKGKAAYRMVWHHDRRFDLLVDVARKTLRFPAVLPGIPRDSTIYRDLKAFLASRHSTELPAHRRIDPAKARLSSGNRSGTVSVTLTVKDGDFEYGARKLINTIHEIFLVFLTDGPYYQYLVEQLGLDPDKY